MKNKINNVFFTICSCITLFVNWKGFYYDGSIFPNNYAFLRLIFGAAFGLLLFYLYQKSGKKNKAVKTLAILFTIFSLIGNSFIITGCLKLLYEPKMLFFTILRTIGFYALFSNTICYLEIIIVSLKNKKNLKNNAIISIFSKKTFIISLFTIAFSWSIYYVAFYPAVLSPDPSFQIKQFFNEKTKYVDYSVQLNPDVNITNHHPVFHTMLLGTSIVLGRSILNDNFGLFIYTFIQGLLLAITFAYTICFLKKYGVKNKYLICMLVLYSLVPMFPFYALNTNKDVYYTMFIIWLTMILIDFIKNYLNEKYPAKKCALLFSVFLALALFRNNGFYLVIVLFPFLLFISKINFKRIFVVFCLFISIYFSYNNILLPYLGITKGSIREALSVFFQQTARLVVYHEDDLSKKDKEIIDRIIDYDIIKDSYNPKKADPIKNTYNKYATKKDLLSYFKVWLKGLANHPVTYIEATINNVYGYFDPEETSWYIYSDYYSVITENNLVNYHYNNYSGLRNMLAINAKNFVYIPVIGLISNIGFCTWIIIAIGVYLLLNKQKKYIIILIPAYVSLLICVISPVNTYFRYAMPYVFSVPLLVGYFLTIKKEAK